MNDLSLMPIGEYKGEQMANVPDNWLLWFWGENKSEYEKPNNGNLNGTQLDIMYYIEDSFEDLP